MENVLDKFKAQPTRLARLRELPLPTSIEEIYTLIPPCYRFSEGLPSSIRENVSKEYLAILDWFAYEHRLLSLAARDEALMFMKDKENIKGFLKFLNIPFPDTITESALLRLLKNAEKIWKYKNTLNALYLYLKSLFGDFFFCEILISVTSIRIFSYYNALVDNTAFYTSADGKERTSYLLPNYERFPIYTVTIHLYSRISDADIQYIRSILPNFLIFFRDTGNNVIIKKFFV